MLIFDRLIVGGVKFVLGKIANAVEAELNNEDVYREQLLAAQLQVELGEMSREAFADLEAEVMLRLREIRERKEGGPRSPMEFKVTGIEATFGGDELG
jgi:hypothetical protein